MKFNPFKLMKKYSKEYPFRFYSILCVLSASAYGEYRYRSMRRKEMLLEQNNVPIVKNEYEEYLEAQRKKQMNNDALNEERNKLKNILNNTNSSDNEKVDNIGNANITTKNEKSSKVKEFIHNKTKKGKESSEKLSNFVMEKTNTGREKVQDMSSKITSFSKEKIQALSDKKPLQNTKKDFKSFFEDFVKSYKKDEIDIESVSSKKYNNWDDEINENPNPERMIFLYDINSPHLK